MGLVVVAAAVVGGGCGEGRAGGWVGERVGRWGRWVGGGGGERRCGEEVGMERWGGEEEET